VVGLLLRLHTQGREGRSGKFFTLKMLLTCLLMELGTLNSPALSQSTHLVCHPSNLHPSI
jgi:hypothetical protein